MEVIRYMEVKEIDISTLDNNADYRKLGGEILMAILIRPKTMISKR